MVLHGNDSMNPAADVIVVLGAAVWPGGRPSPSLLRRTEHAAKLLRASAARQVILTGGVNKNPPSEAEVMKAILLGKGIDETRMIIENRAHSTMENARHCARIIRDNGFDRACIVTDRYHCIRALLAFRAYGIRAAVSVPPRAGNGGNLLSKAYFGLRECVAVPWYALLYAKTRWFSRRD